MTDYKVPFAYKSALLTILQFLVSEGKPAVKKNCEVRGFIDGYHN